jgi:transcriptional regulator with XRE-family HTH domain
MFLYANSEKLREFRKAKGLSQQKISEMLNMEQTTYSKKELGRNLMSYQTASEIALILGKEIDEFVDNPTIINHINDCTLNNSTVNGDVVYTNCTTSVPEKIINTLEELIKLVKVNYKQQ